MLHWLSSHPEAKLLIDGHADAAGEDGKNLALSHRRAERVARQFRNAGVEAARITVRGFGEYQPLVGEAADSLHNRRVSVHVLGYETCDEDNEENEEAE